MAKIVIDAGHGGRDVGAVGKRSTEANNVLKVALAMKPMLERSGHKVILTRSTNVFLSLYQRSKISNDHRADIFISLHNNSASNNSATGFETFIFNGNVSNNTKRLQREIHTHLINGLKLRDRGMKRANFAVLRQTYAPAVLIEYAFINNPSDEQILINDVNKLAQLTVNGINAYFGIKTQQQQTQPKPKPEVNNIMQKELNSIKQRLDNLEGAMLHDTQKKYMKKLLKSAYTVGIFHEDHSSKVATMTQRKALDLMLSYVARKFK